MEEDMAKRWLVGTALIGSIGLLGGAAVAQTAEEQYQVGEQSQMEQEIGAKEQPGQEAMGGSGQMGMEDSIWNQKEQGFTVVGTLTEQDGNDLTISRPNLPPVEIEVRGRTQLNFPGRNVTYQNLEQLPIGSEVRARFQISGDEVIALSLEPAKGAQKKQKSNMGQSPEQQQQP
jgi:hypothetical protein